MDIYRVGPPSDSNTGLSPSTKTEKAEPLPQKQISGDKTHTALPLTSVGQRPVSQTKPLNSLSAASCSTQHKEISPSTKTCDQGNKARLAIPLETIGIFELCGISSPLIAGYKQYAEALLRDYPPESHKLVMFGAQNVLLSGVFATMMSQEQGRDYIKQLPLRRLGPYYYQLIESDLGKGVFQTFMVKAIKAAAVDVDADADTDCNSGSKKIILVRVMSVGLTVLTVTKPLVEARETAGIHYNFDYLAPVSAREYKYSCLHSLSTQGVRLRFYEEMGKHVLNNEEHEMIINFNPYFPVNLLLSGEQHPAGDNWAGFKFNPDFSYLVEWLRSRMGG